jgi:hypothetical protein
VTITTSRRLQIAALGCVLAIGPVTYGQESSQGAQRPAARGNRPAGPPAGPADPQQVQQFLDTYALVQAQEQLQLTDEQFATFAPRLTRLHNVRRRVGNQRRQLLGELRVLLGQTPGAGDEAIMAKVRALDDFTRRGAEEIQKVYVEVDGALTPWQRGRFRMFEEQLERRKIDLLRTLGAARGGGAAGAGS